MGSFGFSASGNTETTDFTDCTDVDLDDRSSFRSRDASATLSAKMGSFGFWAMGETETTYKERRIKKYFPRTQNFFV
jgi:hypothetical protein